MMDVEDLADTTKTKSDSGTVGLRDLARLADVDVSTVSRALSRDPRVSAERAKTIRELARRMGYRPKPMRAKHTRAVGLLIGSDQLDRIGGVGEHFLERIVWIAQQVLGQKRLHVNIEYFLRQDDGTSIPAILQENRVDGVILAGHPAADMVARIGEHGIPAVCINDSATRLGIPCVSSDPQKAIHEAIIRLAALGHRRFGLLMNDLEYPTSQARYKAYGAALADIGISADPNWLVSDLPPEISGGREGIRELARRGKPPTAILCCNDWVALGALMELLSRGVVVPRDVSLIGHDNVSFCESLEPRLSSICRSEHMLVSKAVQLLLDAVDRGNGKAEDTLVEGAVVWRESTGPAKTAASRTA
ncbi:MAG: LacI family DNA-binding transcriptional regulator [Kiritimatiellia bacterium]|jgi:LacI family transcriptional regulator